MISAAMAVKDQSEDIPTNNAFLEDDLMYGAQSATGVQLMDQFCSADLHAPKVRKPYTITKQRERWTDEEHKKFLEALKLYGRAWRKIEEHVGTKTAVQIRSHAQKFFSKVVRDSSGSNTSTTEPIEIPPPRPKRKPMHPYPRKLVHPHKKGVSVPQVPVRSASPILEQENQSPTSVLSAVGSDTLGSASSSSPTGSVSPVSSGAGISNHNSVFLSEPNASREENISPPLDPEAAGVQDDQVAEEAAKFEFFPKDNFGTKEGHGEEESTRCLKLFGRTLLVTDSARPFSPAVDIDSKPPLTGTNNGKHVHTSPWNCGSGECLVANVDHAWNQMVHGASGGSVYYMHYQNGNSNPNEAASHALLPVWAFYGGTPFPYLQFENPGSIDKAYQDSNVGAAQDKEVQKEASWSGSNAESACEGGIGDKNWDLETQSCQISSDGEEKEHPSVCQSKQIEKLASRCMKGFVPYKRCLGERDTQSWTITSGESEEQGIRLCL